MNPNATRAEYGYSRQPSVECFLLRHSFCVDQQKKTRYENSIQVEHTCATAAKGQTNIIPFFLNQILRHNKYLYVQTLDE